MKADGTETDQEGVNEHTMLYENEETVPTLALACSGDDVDREGWSRAEGNGARRRAREGQGDGGLVGGRAASEGGPERVGKRRRRGPESTRGNNPN